MEQNEEILKLKLQLALKDAGATDTDYLAFKAQQISRIELDEAGQIKGIDMLISELKSKYPNYFSFGEGKKRMILQNGKMIPEDQAEEEEPILTKEQFARLPYADRLLVRKKNQALYKTLAL